MTTVTPLDFTFNNSDLSWNSWTAWSECTASCAGGQSLRLMLCDSARRSCPFHLIDAENLSLAYDLDVVGCNLDRCPVDGFWDEWSPWAECSTTCNSGTRSRKRVCRGPFYNGSDCTGPHAQFEICSNSTCVADSSTKPMSFKDELEKIRYKESDHRSSAIGTGVLSLVFLLIELSLIVAFDVLTLSQQVAYGRQNIRDFIATIKNKRRYHRVNRTRDVSQPNPPKTSVGDG